MIAVRLVDVGVFRIDGRGGGRVPALEGVDWQVEAGQRWAVLGPNGAGKSTLLNVAGAVSFPSSGRAEVLGARFGEADLRSVRLGVGFVDARLAREFDFWPEQTVADVVRSGATASIAPRRRVEDAGVDARAAELTTRFALEALAPRRFAECSEGERQRALLARALMAGPRLLVLDEPTAALDLPGRELLLAALDRLAGDDAGLATVTSLHHLEDIPSSTTHALLLRAGRIVATGPADEVLRDGPVSACFGLEVGVQRDGGRWRAGHAR